MLRSTRLTLACLALPLTIAVSSCGDGLELTPNLSGPKATISGGGTATPTPTATQLPPRRSDLNGDGFVDHRDLVLFQEDWLR